MAGTRSGWMFVIRNVVVWIAMTAILVVVPDQLEHYLPLPMSRVIGWAIACSVWVVAVEQQWKERYGVFSRFFVQLFLWVTAALFAIWISDQFRVR
jgi:hypothetical protein